MNILFLKKERMESENTKISNKKFDSTNNVVAQETSTKIQVEDVSEGKKEDVSTTENSEETAEQKTSQEGNHFIYSIFNLNPSKHK